MTPTEYQQWLGTHGHPVVVDGKAGAKTGEATIAVFTNTCADSITDAEVDAIALRLKCSSRQLRAVAEVESGGSGYDKQGRPKILFERHIFHRLTDGKWSVRVFSDPKGGGYKDDSWNKLNLAIARDVEMAFASASWGKFQIMGMHWNGLGYDSPLEMAYSTVTGEAAHYEMLARFIEKNGLGSALRALSADPATCRDFARRYNGPSYAQNRYDVKLAEEMA